MRHFKHLSFNDRLKIEALLKAKVSKKEIAQILGVHISTVYRELERGQYEHLNSDYTTEMRYSPDIAEAKYQAYLSAKGAPLKIGSDYEFADFIEQKILHEKYSPAAILGEMEATGVSFGTKICVRTLYNYIDKGIFLNVTNRDLPMHGQRHSKRRYRKVRKAARPPAGESIENRPQEINERNTFGHWEMDCAVGKSKKTLLVLTERLTREEIIIKMKDKTTQSVALALDKIERKYGKAFPLIFKSITVDNGSEFAGCSDIERSVYGDFKRTKMYYCHPYSSYERGSNENQNRLIRRHLPKDTNFDRISLNSIRCIEKWINNYPRKIFSYHTSEEFFQQQLATIAV